MNELVKFSNGLLTAHSKEVAEKFGKTHRDVLRAISNLECSEEFRERNFALSYYTSQQNKQIKCYEITRDGFAFLGMGFTGAKCSEWKEAYINAFNQMEQHLKESPSMMDKINEALAIMEQDKRTASICSKGLNEWKRLKKIHKEEVDRLVSTSQIVLNLI